MNYKLIIIIGLSGSGKSTLANKMTDYIIYDDFISKFYNGDVLKSIKSNQKVCLIDPRLCIPSIFTLYIKKIEQVIDKSQIQLILFNNDPITCLKNIKNRNDGRVGIDKAINLYSIGYKLENYNSWQCMHYIVKDYSTVISIQPQ